MPPYSLKIWYFRQVCRGRIDASRAVLPIYRYIRAAATGGIVAVPTNDPQNCHHRKTRGGHSFFLVSYLFANCNNKLSIQLVRGLLFEEDPAPSRREPQASDETGPERGVKQQISDPFLPRMLHPEYGTPGPFAEGRWPTAPRPESYLHRNCRLSFPLAGIGGSDRCGSQWYLFHRKYTDA